MEKDVLRDLTDSLILTCVYMNQHMYIIRICMYVRTPENVYTCVGDRKLHFLQSFVIVTFTHSYSYSQNVTLEKIPAKLASSLPICSSQSKAVLLLFIPILHCTHV